jgi:uncharacterized surface protein with fasciclin (FAS1) repeats
MKKTIVGLSLIALMALMLIVPTVGADSIAPADDTGNSIVDIAIADGRFTTLVSAVVAADLAEALSGGEWTVFAPTDDAFAKLGLNAKNIADAFTKEELTDILLYHALSGEVFSDKAIALVGDITMANGQKAGLKVADGSLYVNDDSKVIIADIAASNGAIHVVDTVILGPWPKMDDDSASVSASSDTSSASIVDIAIADGRFDTLVAAVIATDLVDALSGGTWTVFAPTDAAFAKLGLDENNIATKFTKAELTDILLYHALSGEIFSDKAKALVGDVTMANGQVAGLKVVDGDLYVNDDAKVIIADIAAENGAIHVVDTVILGPWPKVASE